MWIDEYGLDLIGRKLEIYQGVNIDPIKRQKYLDLWTTNSQKKTQQGIYPNTINADAKVVVISLERRIDRRDEFAERWEQSGFASLYEFYFFNAFDGNHLKMPNEIRCGNGGWGCTLSHTAILHEALSDPAFCNCGNSPLWIMEDDCTFVPDALERFQTFLLNVKESWQMLFLGGQNRRPPTKISNGVVAVLDCHRTHSMIIRGADMLFSLYRSAITGSSHIDHSYSRMQPRHRGKIFAPTEWICGQSEGMSDISARGQLAERMWT